MLSEWGTECDVCKCKSACECGGYKNLPTFEEVYNALELKNKKTDVTNEHESNISEDECER